MSLADYLAKNYLTASKPPQKSKKRKRKAVEPSGLTISSEDLTGWSSKNSNDSDDNAPITLTSKPTAFRKSTRDNWITVGSSAPSASTTTPNPNDDNDTAAADAIISLTAAENTAESTDDAPTLADDTQTMHNGAPAGLQSAASVAAAVKNREKEERRRAQDALASGSQETVYRDASGRIVNVALKRAELRKAADAAALKAREDVESRQGEVQRAEAVARKEALGEAKLMGVARYADDEGLNEEMRGVERWGDPMAGVGGEGGKKGRSRTGRPLYKGHAAPNRYGIKPGHKWDGVERGNGFEREWFEARNQRRGREELEFMWQMDE
ncbi:hypothetical protein M501DRAFT_936906 [Patellaria atrata CBS 101060]|uniref:Pre-mRNA-splicing factor CWC26 n=1 Tax=Patellaria atrata CBS 101060 TaxID=1346257 RepID=A0A9P4S7V7_9PEZI|nr:hypothetical protein M501DRAFT_936906 [Patellaria atrata CBS 101060]